MKITFVNWGTSCCGGNRVLFEVANGLINKGHDVGFIALQSQNWFPLKAPITVAKDPQDLFNIVPDSDIVVATWFASAYVVDAVKGRKGIPAYYCQHYETVFFQCDEDRKQVTNTYDLPLNLISNSPWLQQKLLTLHNRESTLIVPGVDHSVFQPKIRQFTKDKDEKYKILAFASPTQFKGFYDTVLPAFHFVSRYFANVEFHIFGTQPESMPLPDYLKDKAQWHGALSDAQLAKLYQEMDMFVSGSYAESSPLPHLEAMASYCPVVCTQYGTEHYGTGLRRVPPRRPRDLAYEILELLKDPAQLEVMAKQALVDVAPLTWEATTEGAERFFRGLVGE